MKYLFITKQEKGLDYWTDLLGAQRVSPQKNQILLVIYNTTLQSVELKEIFEHNKFKHKFSYFLVLSIKLRRAWNYVYDIHL